MIGEKYKALIDYFAVKDIGLNSEQLRANRLLVNVCVLTSIVALFYVPMALLVGYRVAMIFMSISFLVHWLTLFLFKKGLSYDFCSHLYVFNNTFIAIVPCVYFSGGFLSPAMPWFALININALMLLGLSRPTFGWVGVNSLIILVFALAEMWHYPFPHDYAVTHFNLFLLLCVLGLSMIILLVTSVFENTSRNTLHMLTLYNAKVEEEKRRSDELLLNILPPAIADRLRLGEQPIADYFENASVVFIDIVNFTAISSNNPPKQVVELLNKIFTHIDKICAKYEMEKIKTIGDSYMAASGIPVEKADHAIRAICFARDVLQELDDYYTPNGEKICFRVGLHGGPLIAGVIGKQKFIYDLWGDTVNLASRMESQGVINTIHCTHEFKLLLDHQQFDTSKFEERGLLEIKGKGKVRTWLFKRQMKVS